jgi:hypothetical protein
LADEDLSAGGTLLCPGRDMCYSGVRRDIVPMGDRPSDDAPAPQDRTLLDPINADELKALREARARSRQDRSSAIAHQVVIGPDADEDFGNAKTRAIPVLPSFDSGGASLDAIGASPAKKLVPTSDLTDARPGKVPVRNDGDEAVTVLEVASNQVPKMRHPARTPVVDPATRPSISTPSIGANAPSAAVKSSVEGLAREPAPAAERSAKAPVEATSPKPEGFGTNTMMWMQAPELPGAAAKSGPVGVLATGDLFPRGREALKRRLGTIAAAGGVLTILGVFIAVGASGKERGVLELHTNPPRAHVIIDGDPFEQLTPMKLTLPAGMHKIDVSLEGHESYSFSLEVQPGEEPLRRDVELNPVSVPGKMTVSLAVQPVASNITFDGEVFAGRRSAKLANVDPRTAHTLKIESGGYVPIRETIPAGTLKESYTFVLQKEVESP